MARVVQVEAAGGTYRLKAVAIVATTKDTILWLDRPRTVASEMRGRREDGDEPENGPNLGSHDDLP
jgi:hypothetical protein